MLVGRTEELETISALLAQACAGDGGTLVVRGEPGVGKTALLDAAAERAGTMRVLRGTGVAWEAEIAFSGALQLLAPILERVTELPDPQRRALEGALALAEGVERDRFAVGAATLGLLVRAASATPLLLLVDDAQWFDSASLEALVFASRRITGDQIAVLFAVRDGFATALDAADVPALTVPVLDLA